MPGLHNYIDQILDDKYRLERLLGKGGMGAVYLATHLGTERYVALKLITPQFMRNEEFVERFKREAKAAGRLRHPNVVDVTDFGFARADGEPVAYLVMEYLDGCTLGDVLREEERLPLEWVVDILEQVCSAVHEAHQQGIVHRDLKPENIWLEPNRLGGYRVKVLDFGIAKLGRATAPALAFDEIDLAERTGGGTTQQPGKATHFGDHEDAATAMFAAIGARSTDLRNAVNPELDTVLYNEPDVTGHFVNEPEDAKQPIGNQLGGRAAETNSTLSEPDDLDAIDETATAVLPAPDDDGTLMFEQDTRPFMFGSQTTAATSVGAELTRVGAIMGTPLYMSPEQCVGKSLDWRADIYSLGVIAYQMLAGEPPFTGDTSKVMREHIEIPPLPLRERAKVPKRVAGVVMSALAKDPQDRPQSASAFALSLSAQASTIGLLYRRAFALYSEYFPKFLKISLIAHVPVLITTTLMIALQITERSLPGRMSIWRILVLVGIGLVGLVHAAAYFVAASAISGMTAVIVTQVSAAPLRPVEVRVAFAVLKKRWKPFLKTSLRITVGIIIGYVLLIVPGIVRTVRYSLYAPVVLMEGLQGKAAMKRAREMASRSWRTMIIITLLQVLIPFTVGALFGRLTFKASHANVGLTLQTITQNLSGVANIFILPLMSIVPALLYLKMRQLGGETMSSALAQIEEIDVRKRSQWQQRMRSRVTLPTPRGRE